VDYKHFSRWRENRALKAAILIAALYARSAPRSRGEPVSLPNPPGEGVRGMAIERPLCLNVKRDGTCAQYQVPSCKRRFLL
jgi:hypothetical protein